MVFRSIGPRIDAVKRAYTRAPTLAMLCINVISLCSSAQRILGRRTQGVDRPRQGVLRGVLADSILARLHHPGDLRGERAALGVSDGGDLGRPRAHQNWDNGADPGPEPGVDDRGQVAGLGQIALADRGRQDL